MAKQDPNREYPRYVHSKDGRSAYVESQEQEKALKGDWQDLPYHPERDDAEAVPQKPPVETVYGDDMKAELDAKAAHDLMKDQPAYDPLDQTGYVDQEDAPDEVDEDGAPKKRGRPRKEG